MAQYTFKSKIFFDNGDGTYTPYSNPEFQAFHQEIKEKGGSLAQSRALWSQMRREGSTRMNQVRQGSRKINKGRHKFLATKNPETGLANGAALLKNPGANATNEDIKAYWGQELGNYRSKWTNRAKDQWNSLGGYQQMGLAAAGAAGAGLLGYGLYKGAKALLGGRKSRQTRAQQQEPSQQYDRGGRGRRDYEY